MIAFAHLSAVGADHFGKLRQMLLWFRKHGGFVDVVETPRKFPRQFKMRELVLAHRDEIRLVQENVGCLQNRVSQKAVGGEIFFFDLFLLLLVRRIAFELCVRSHH